MTNFLYYLSTKPKKLKKVAFRGPRGIGLTLTEVALVIGNIPTVYHFAGQEELCLEPILG